MQVRVSECVRVCVCLRASISACVCGWLCVYVHVLTSESKRIPAVWTCRAYNQTAVAVKPSRLLLFS